MSGHMHKDHPLQQDHGFMNTGRTEEDLTEYDASKRQQHRRDPCRLPGDPRKRLNAALMADVPPGVIHA